MQSPQTTTKPTPFSIYFPWLLLAVGLGFRLVNLTNPPLDYAAWRQLSSAVISRGWFYQASSSISADLVSRAQTLADMASGTTPNLRVFERLVAWTYLVTGQETLWAARLWSILFWMAGGLALDDFLKRRFGPIGRAAALGFYLFSPLALSASRSFTPEPLSVMGLCLTLNFVDRFLHGGAGKKSRWWVLSLAGVSLFVSMLVHPAALVLAAVYLGISRISRSAELNPTGWRRLVLSLAMGAAGALLVWGLSVSLAGWQAWLSSTIRDLASIVQPRFYLLWLSRLNRDFDLVVVGLALAGVAVFHQRDRAALAGLWLTYALVFLLTPSVSTAQPFLHVTIIPLMAYSLAPLGETVIRMLWEGASSRAWQSVLVGVSLALAAFIIGREIEPLISDDYHDDAQKLTAAAGQLPEGQVISGLTRETNARLMYFGMVSVTAWRTPEAEDRLVIGQAGVHPHELISTLNQTGATLLVYLPSELLDMEDVKSYLSEKVPVETISPYRVVDLASLSVPEDEE